MNLNDYEAIWKRQELPVGANATIAELKITFEAKRRKLAATLLLRDFLESSAGLFVAVAFGLKGWKMGIAAWPIAISVVLLLGVSAFFIFERIRTRRKRLGAEAPLFIKLTSDITELKHQRHLLLNVAFWYLTPCLAALVIFAHTIGANLPHPAPRHPAFQTGYWIFVAFIYWRIWKLNRRTVQKQIDPRLEELEKIYADLLSSK